MENAKKVTGDMLVDRHPANILNIPVLMGIGMHTGTPFFPNEILNDVSFCMASILKRLWLLSTNASKKPKG